MEKGQTQSINRSRKTYNGETTNGYRQWKAALNLVGKDDFYCIIRFELLRVYQNFLKIGDTLFLCKTFKGSYQIANLILMEFTIHCILF